MKILIVEDNSSAALILRRTLERVGHEVTVACDGVEAWARLQLETFPLVISDWMMPGMDGPTLCQRIRERAGTPYIYVILLTSRAERQDRLEGLFSGADDFIEKPLGHGELFARLEIAQRLLAVQEELHQRTILTEELNTQLGDQLRLVKQLNRQLEEANAQLRVTHEQ